MGVGNPKYSENRMKNREQESNLVPRAFPLPSREKPWERGCTREHMVANSREWSQLA